MFNRLAVFIFLLALVPLIVIAQDCPAEGCPPPPAPVEMTPFAQSLGGPAVDRALLDDRRYMRVESGLDVYDAPNGNVIRTLSPGYVFLTTRRDNRGWTEINTGEFVRTRALTNVNGNISQFAGVFIPGGLPHPIGWALQSTWTVNAPGVEPVKNVGTRIRQYDRLNIYNVAEVNGVRYYQTGPDQWISQFLVGKVQPLGTVPEGVSSGIWIGIDLYEQVLILYEGATPIYSTLISSGLSRWQTREGLFNIYFRTGREDMSWGEVGDDYYLLEEVPWTMFFDDAIALHGTYWHNGLGYRRSHGCVNMSITDAKWLFDRVAAYMGPDAHPSATGPSVFVYSTGEYNR